MSRQLIISDLLYEIIQQDAVPFEDTVESVLMHWAQQLGKAAQPTRLPESESTTRKSADVPPTPRSPRILATSQQTSPERIIIPINTIYSPREWGLIRFHPDQRRLFPGYKTPFYLETDIGEIETKVTSADRGKPAIGDPVAGRSIQGNLIGWYQRHPELRDGSVLVLEVIIPKRRYRLGIASV